MMIFRYAVLFCGLMAVGVMAQTPSLTIPAAANDRARLDRTDSNNIKMLNSIVHTNLGTEYEIVIKYYAANCEGAAVTPAPALDIMLDTIEVSGVYTSTIINTLANIRNNPTFFVTSPAARYQYCIEFALQTTVSNTIVDRVRYKVVLAAAADGAVSTDAVVETDIDTSPDGVTFTARVEVCDPGTYAVVNTEFFQGDAINFCFHSNNFPEASIIGITSFALQATVSPTPTVTIAAVTVGAAVTDVVASIADCVVTAGATGKQRCAIAIPLDDSFNSMFQLPGTQKTVTASGTLTMRFGTARRNVRILFQEGQTFPRNANTTFAITAADEKDDACSSCSEWFFLFKFICWIINCLF